MLRVVQGRGSFAGSEEKELRQDQSISRARHRWPTRREAGTPRGGVLAPMSKLCGLEIAFLHRVVVRVQTPERAATCHTQPIDSGQKGGARSAVNSFLKFQSDIALL